MNQERTRAKFQEHQISANVRLANSYYACLGLHPSASVIAIRRSYWKLSKRYHPDTTDLPQEIAKVKFHKINEAYATLSNPERRSLYDLKIGYSRVNVIQSIADLEKAHSSFGHQWSSSAYLDPTDRPLSAGEIFVLFILGLTFVGCLLLVIIIGLIRGDSVFSI